jgi:hypothetical protein
LFNSFISQGLLRFSCVSMPRPRGRQALNRNYFQYFFPLGLTMIEPV